MMLPIYHNNNNSYIYDTETGHYLLYDNNHRSRTYLQGDDDAVLPEPTKLAQGGAYNPFLSANGPQGRTREFFGRR